MAIHWLDWAAPSNVRAAYSCRHGGFSLGDYAGLNLGDHVQDDPQVVERNRQQVIEMLQCPSAPIWLTQTHSTRVFIADGSAPIGDYDASYTNQVAQTLVVMTADCLPLFVCDRAGTEIAVIHAGWRGLLDGVIENTIAQFKSTPEQLMVHLGPAISQSCFEVGREVLEAFVQQDAQAQAAFKPLPQANKYLADLYKLAKQRLIRLGIDQVTGGDLCTYQQPEQFYSFRRDGLTGRMAHFIWLQP